MADRYSDYYTPEQTPFIGQDLLGRGLGYLLNRASKVPPMGIVKLRVGTKAFPKDQKRIAKAALKASEARTNLDDELQKSDLGQRLQAHDAMQRYQQAVAAGGLGGPLSGQVAVQAAQPQATSGGIGGPPPTAQTYTQPLGPPLDIPNLSGLSSLITRPSTLPPSNQPIGGVIGAPLQAGLAGQTVLGGARTGSLPPDNIIGTADTIQPSPTTIPQYNMSVMPGLPGLLTERGPAGDPRQPHYPSAQIPDNPKAGFISDVLDVLPDGAVGAMAEGAATRIDPAPDAFQRQLIAATKPQGPYGSGGTDMGDALSWVGDKLQQGMDYMGTVPVPGILSDPVGTISGLAGKGGKDEPVVIPPDSVFPEDVPPEEDAGGGGGADGKGGTSSLDSAIEKYLTETDTSYDDALKTIKHAYGDMDTTYKNPKQDAADAYMAREGERTAALAQLAMAGGLIKSAGKSWEGAGQGVLDSAGVYSQGFDRYQKALNDSADRYDERQKDNRALELAQRGAALTMWQSGQTDRRALMRDLFTQARDDARTVATNAREDMKFTIENINKRFESDAAVRFPKDGSIEIVPKERDDFYDRWSLSIKLRRPISEEEFKVMKARAAAKAAAKASGVVKVDVSD